MFTQFGKLLRKIRIDQGMLLKGMAEGVGVSAAFLSAVETGKKVVSDDLVERIAKFLSYAPGSADFNKLQDAAVISRGEISMSTRDLDDKQQETALAFARNLESLQAKDLDKILNMLKATKKQEG